jgi:two-component system sensor histidine kinase/response regulator
MSRLPRPGRLALAPSLAAVSALVMLVLTLLTLQFVGHTMAHRIEVDIGDTLAELAYQTTDKLDRGVFERYREVRLMAQRPELGNPAVPAAVKRALLEGMQSTYPHYAWIGLTDNRGRVKVSTGAMLEGLDVSARPWFAAAYEGEHLQDVHEAVLLAKLLPNASGEPKRFFDIAFPYHTADGAIAGVLGTHLSWQWAGEVERSVLRPLAERKAVDSLILGKGGAVLLGPKEYAGRVLDQPSVKRAKREGTGWVIEDWPDGKRYLVGYSRSPGHASYPGLGWTVVVRQPVEVAFAPVDRLRAQILWAGLGAAVLVSLLVWLLARNITRPLRRITAYAEALEAGQLRQIPPIPSHLTEVHILQQALNTLLEKLFANQQGLRELNATLETRVAERTRELDAAVADTRRGERRVRAIIDGALDAFVGVDTHGRITDWNPRAEEIFGWRRDEAMGKTVTETIIPPRFRQAHEAGMRRFTASGSSAVVGRRLHLCALRRNGEEFQVEMTIGLVSADDTHFFGTFIQDISLRKQIEDDLARERELLDAVLDSIDVGVVACSQDGSITMSNRAAQEIPGLSSSLVAPGQAGFPCALLLADGKTAMSPGQSPLARALAGEQVENAEMVVRPAYGAPRFLFASGRALHARDGSGIGAVIALKDVSALKESARRLEASERKLRTITNNVPVLIAYIDDTERYRFANATHEEWYGVPVKEIAGKSVREVIGDRLYLQTRQQLLRSLAGEEVRFELEQATPTGTRIIEVTGIPDLHDGVGRGTYVLGADITAAKLHAAELKQLARVDQLTGLPNRRDYHDRLQAALQRAQRAGQGLALMYLDIDRFKQVNDTLGHAAGDAVLCEFARRVRKAVRVTDTVCRLAGDEFTVILEGLKSADEAALVAQKILKAFDRPFALEQGERGVSTSVGVAYADRFPVDAAALGEAADQALYAAKNRGRRCFVVSSIASATVAG